MIRVILSLAVLTALLPLSASLQARAEKKRGKNRQSEDAARWVSASHPFSLSLSGNGKDSLVFTTDKKAVADGPQGKVFPMSKEEAAAFVQVVVDCGLWDRNETSLPGGPIAGRILGLGNGDPQGGKIWILGARSDDLSSLFLFRHLLQTFQAERLQAVKDWLTHGMDEKGP